MSVSQGTPSVFSPVGAGGGFGEVIALSGGGYFMVWQQLVSPFAPVDGTTDNNGTAVFGRLFNADGAPSGAVFQINRETDGFQTEISLTELSNGNVAVAWTDGPGLDGVVDARAVILSASGAFVSDEIHLRPDPDNDQRLPVVAPTEGGGFVVAWEDDVYGRSGENYWMAQVFDATGAATTPEMRVITGSRLEASEDAHLAALGNELFALTVNGESAVFGSTPYTYDWFGQDITETTQIGGGARPLGFREDDAIGLGDGRVATVDLEGDGSIFRPLSLTVRVFETQERDASPMGHGDGTQRTEAQYELVETTSVEIDMPDTPFRAASNDLPAAALAATPEGNLLVVWAQVSGGTSTAPEFSLYGQVVHPAGAMLTGVMMIADGLAGTQLLPPFVAVGTDGRALIGWTGESGRTGDGSQDLMGDVYSFTLPDRSIATEGNDMIVGTDGGDTFYGSGGQDTIYGLDGDDIFFQDADQTELYDGRIVASSLLEDYWYGNGGNDHFVITLLGASGEVSQREFPGAGMDTLDYSRVAHGLEVTNNLIVPGSDFEHEFERVIGTFHDDLLVFETSNRSDSPDWSLHAESGNDTITGYFFGIPFGSPAHTYTVDGGAGTDQIVIETFGTTAADFALVHHGDHYTLGLFQDDGTGGRTTDTYGEVVLRSIESIRFNDGEVALSPTASVASGALGRSTTPPPPEPTAGPDTLSGTAGDDRLTGLGGDDLLNGSDGNDTLIGGEGNDTLIGGTSENDLRDIVYGGNGNDSIDGGYGNDELRGDAGDDTIEGGFGADTVIGGAGNDILTGSAWSDLIFGGDGDDFVNGGWGHDRVNGGAGADRFFHIGIRDHGSDWIQDYDSSEGDVLVFGIGTATADQFQINTTHTSSPDGERSGEDNIEEAFVIYRPTGQIMWALVDGAGQDSINLMIAGQVYDLMA